MYLHLILTFFETKRTKSWTLVASGAHITPQTSYLEGIRGDMKR